MEDVTLCIKSFDRHLCLERLLTSIRQFYPDTPVLIADDGRETFGAIAGQLEGFGPGPVRVITMPFDSGMSAGRNLMMQEAETSRVVLLDDDFIFCNATRIEDLVDGLDLGYDIVAGYLKIPPARGNAKPREQHYEGFMITHGEKLLLFRVEARQEIIPVDIVLNFFAARRDVLRDHPWDNELKICEHEDYFWRGKRIGLRVGYCPTVWAWHQRERYGDYNKFRNSRVRELRAIAMEKNGWKDQIWYAI